MSTKRHIQDRARSMEKLTEIFTGFFEDAESSSDGKMPWPRLIFFPIFLYMWIMHLRVETFRTPLLWGLDLGIHELGHFLFSPFGEFVMFLGGSLFQCLVPIIAMVMFYRQKDFFAIGVAFAWLSDNFFEVATYVADARVMELPLVSPFGMEVQHDWNWLLYEMDILHKELALAALIRYMASLSMFIGIVFSGWIVYLMIKSYQKSPNLNWM